MVELANRQALVNYHLVLHHYHLAVAAAIQLSSGLRLHILSILFCPIGQRAFFHPLDSHPLIPLEKVDDAVMERRHQFLAKIAEQGTDTDRKLARILSCEWNLTVDTIQTTLSSGLRLHILSILFCPIGQRAFFHPLDSHPLIPLEKVDDAVMERRHQFLAKIAEQGTDTDRKLARILSCEWNLTVDTIQTTQVLCHLRAGQDEAASREMTGITQTEHFLTTTAGDERLRVDWSNSDWKEAVRSFGKIVSALSLHPQFLTPFIRIGGITTQYWGITILD
ncbi:unnamed protein product [Strongylus vulgaris]|uniref:Rab3GAP regulatory subunit C-terminal domain-containing protein n=1 Tax=Strongylus vulgaris TaxID=40348 RepID=A0A3P7JP57_STRVU|nr:unnamed protein product [Strongylus vulgaris]